MAGGMWFVFGRNQAKRFVTGAVSKDLKLAQSRGIRDGLAILQSVHKEQVVKRGGGAPIRRRWTTRSGELRRSFGISFRLGDLQGSYGSDLFRAEVLEKGKVILPRKKTYLRFKVNGKWVATKRVVIPPRPTLDIAVKGSIRDRDVIMRKRIDEALVKE